MRGSSAMIKFLAICGAVLLIMLFASHTALITDVSNFVRDLTASAKAG